MKNIPDDVIRFADMMAAMGAEPRLRIMRTLLSAHPRGMVVGDIQNELGIPGSTLSHHLEKLKNEGLVSVRRERQFLRYTADTDALQQLLSFLYEECCSGRRPGRSDRTPKGRRVESPDRSLIRERR
jgi:DNA-binding transcriptional ArsR family regulator